MQRQQQQQQRRAHAPRARHRTADISRGWNPQTLSRVICDEPTCPGMGCTFSGCDLLFPSSPPSRSYSHHITHPKSTKARCASSRRPIPRTTQTQCWYWTKWQTRSRANPRPCAPPPPRRWGSRDHRLVRHVPVRRDQDAHASVRHQHRYWQQCRRRYIVARRPRAVRRGRWWWQRRAHGRILARFRAYDRARRTGQYGRLWYVRRRRMGLLATNNSQRAGWTALLFEQPSRESYLSTKDDVLAFRHRNVGATTAYTFAFKTKHAMTAQITHAHDMFILHVAIHKWCAALARQHEESARAVTHHLKVALVRWHTHLQERWKATWRATCACECRWCGVCMRRHSAGTHGRTGASRTRAASCSSALACASLSSALTVEGWAARDGRGEGTGGSGGGCEGG